MAAVGVALGAGEAEAAAGRRRREHRPRKGKGNAPRPMVFDVAVVNAGLAGLTAAHRVRDAGRSVVVLEARDRVGGRNLDQPIGPGKVAELWGDWTGPGQDRVLGLAHELGIATFPTFSARSNVYYRGGQLQTYSGDIPPANAAALAELALATVELNKMAASVPAEQPWTASRARAWDQQTIAGWASEHLQTTEARELVDLAMRGVYGEEPTAVSLLELLAAITGVGGDMNTLIGSAQSTRFVGGPQQLSVKLAAQLEAIVRLGMPVSAIAQGSNAVIHASSETVAARRVILTPPKPLIGRIGYMPALPPAHDQILQRQPMGSVVKINPIYTAPFWRDAGRSGAATSDTGPVRITYDNSPPDGRPGVLVGFMEGDDSRAFYQAPVAARRHAALESFARYFGAQALHPIGYFDQAWAQEPFTRGAYGSYNPPGVLTSLHDAIVQPVGAVHFAGADTSPLWPRCMDGAIRSGERAAGEVRAEL